MHQGAEIRWVEASYTAIHHVLTNPAYAGAYAYGKSRRETMLNASGVRRKRVRNYLAPSGRCSFRTIIRASSIGGPMRPTRIASPRIPDPDRTKRAAP
jgi:Recombinase